MVKQAVTFLSVGELKGAGLAASTGVGTVNLFIISALLSGMNADTGSGEWQLASGLLSEIDVDSEEWQLAVVLLSEMDVGGNKWQRASGLLNRINVGGYEWQLALALPSEETLAATSGNSHWVCSAK